MQSAADSQLIESLRKALQNLPNLVRQGVTQAFGSTGHQRVHVQSASAAATQDYGMQDTMAAQQPSTAQNAAAAKVDIPVPCVESGLKSMEGVWSEWKVGTTSRPAICKLYQDHGKEWMQKRYGYIKQAWKRKRSLICAVIALKDLECTDHTKALQLLKAKMTSGVLDGITGLCRFAEKLPSLDAEIHPDGRHTVMPTGLMRITAEHAQLYVEYKAALRRVLKLSAEVSKY